MVRRAVHKLYDLLSCEDSLRNDNILKKFGHVKSKNLILKDCILSFSQLKQAKSGFLIEKLLDI